MVDDVLNHLSNVLLGTLCLEVIFILFFYFVFHISTIYIVLFIFLVVLLQLLTVIAFQYSLDQQKQSVQQVEEFQEEGA